MERFTRDRFRTDSWHDAKSFKLQITNEKLEGAANFSAALGAEIIAIIGDPHRFRSASHLLVT